MTDIVVVAAVPARIAHCCGALFYRSALAVGMFHECQDFLFNKVFWVAGPQESFLIECRVCGSRVSIGAMKFAELAKRKLGDCTRSSIEVTA